MKTTKRKRGSAATAKVQAVAQSVSAAPVRTSCAEASGPALVLASNCSVKDAAALKISLCKLADQSVAVTVDMSSVERVDTATMQLLCAFARDRAARERKVVWLGQSRAMQEAARLLGVEKLLALPETASKGVAA